MDSLFYTFTLILSAYDLRNFRLPNPYVLGVLTLAVFKDPISATAAVGGLALMGLVYVLSNGRLGLGDVKLFTALSAYVGWGEILPMFARSFLLAAGFSLFLIMKNGISRRSVIPFGPFLCLAALLSL